MTTLRIGDIIRNIKPYWGESIKQIVSEDDKQYSVRIGPGKYGGWQEEKHHEIIFKSENECYRKATVFERIWLAILGWIIDTFW